MENYTEHLAQLCVSFNIYDQAPQVASRLFSDFEGDAKKDNIKFEKEYAKAQDSLTQRVVGCAYNYAVVSTSIRTGEIDTAKSILTMVRKKDIPIYYMNLFLSYFGTNFVELSLKCKEFLVPKRLDAYLY